MSAITFGRTLQRWRNDQFVVTGTLHSAGLRLPLHDHETANVTIVLRGGFEERVERRSFSAARGSVIVKPAGARHANAYGTHDVECVTIEVPAALRFPEVRHFVSPLFPLLAERVREGVSGLDVEEIVHRIAGPDIREPHAKWLSVIEQMLREETVTSLAQLGAAVGRHPAHVAREFRAYYGCSVGEFVRARRVETARDALRDSDRAIAEIALEAGFYDQSHFTNVFRRFLGTTPERYRAQRSSKTKPRRRP
ncbi:MAG: helix-turn-helix domain-containing protein [Thermoanaerobaculia bacterium]